MSPDRRLHFLLLLVFVGCSHAGPPDLRRPDIAPSFSSGLPAGVVVLGASGAGALDQCSRPVPEVGEGFWTPSADAVRSADAKLHGLADSRHSCRPPRPYEGYVRQYIGVFVGGRRLLYVNAAAYDPADPKTSYTEPVVYCDGGSHFWGALVDPDSERIVSIQVNGPFGPGYECTPAIVGLRTDRAEQAMMSEADRRELDLAML